MTVHQVFGLSSRQVSADLIERFESLPVSDEVGVGEVAGHGHRRWPLRLSQSLPAATCSCRCEPSLIL